MPSFSENSQIEAMKQTSKKLSDRQAILAGIFCSEAERFAKKIPRAVKLGEKNAEYVYQLLEKSELKGSLNKDTRTVTLEDEAYEEFAALCDVCFKDKGPDMLSEIPDFRRNYLKGIFIANGYVSDPHITYRIELHIKNICASEVAVWMLNSENINIKTETRGNTDIIRFSGGDDVSDFLAMVGAAGSMLEFENIRTEKEVRADVNRMVNCDSGNSRRVAEASAERTEAFRKLLASKEAVKIPKELMEAALVAVNNPGLSITELGQLMNPPISKSGMNHRLKKLMELASEV